jgi:hypothetical protein
MRQRNCAIARILYPADFEIVEILNISRDIKGGEGADNAGYMKPANGF